MIDEKGIIIGSELTDNHVSDVSQGKEFIRNLGQNPSAILADGGYNLNEIDAIIIERYIV